MLLLVCVNFEDPKTVVLDLNLLRIMLRKIGLVSGKSKSKPRASVQKPGVNIRAPAKRTNPPSTSSLLGSCPPANWDFIFRIIPIP